MSVANALTSNLSLIVCSIKAVLGLAPRLAFAAQQSIKPAAIAPSPGATPPATATILAFVQPETALTLRIEAARTLRDFQMAARLRSVAKLNAPSRRSPPRARSVAPAGKPIVMVKRAQSAEAAPKCCLSNGSPKGNRQANHRRNTARNPNAKPRPVRA